MRQPLLDKPSIGTQGGVLGRTRKLAPAYTPWPIHQEPPENVQERIRRLAAEGKTLVLIAHELGTSDEVLRRWMREDQNLAWAYKVGMAQDEEGWVSYLRRDAMDAEKPNTNALAYLNRRHGWRRDDENANPARVNIVFNIPAALSRDDFMKTVVSDQQVIP